MHVEQVRSIGRSVGQRQVLLVVVAKDERADLLGHARQQLIALLSGQVSSRHNTIEEDLDIDLVVGGVDARGVVDEVGVHPAP